MGRIASSKSAPRLRGSGSSRNISISDADFGIHEFAGPGTLAVHGCVTITAEGTRPVSIDELAINPGTHFEFDPAWLAANDWAIAGGATLQLDPDGIVGPQSIEVCLLFAPRDADPPRKEATIDVVGDFAHGSCSITDSYGTLTGMLRRYAANVSGVDFGSMLACFIGDASIVVRNGGTEPVQAVAINPVVPARMAAYFSIDPSGEIALPLAISPGDSALIPVRFSPNEPGSYDATVGILLMNADGTREIAILTAPLSGTALTASASASIRRDHRGSPGTSVTVPITLNDAIDAARARELIVTLEYDEDVLGLGDMTLGDLLPEAEGWIVEIVDKRPGSITVVIRNSAGRFVIGIGDMLKFEFFPLKGEKHESEIEFSMLLNNFGENFNPCAKLTESPGHFTVEDSDGTGSVVSILDVSPNPLANWATITYKVDERGRVRIGVYSSDGRRVALLLDEEKEEGIYEIMWDAADAVNGAYYIQIKAGDDHDSRAVRVIH